MLLFLLLLSLILTTVNGEVDSVRSRLLAAQGIKELKYSWFEDVNCQAGGCIFGDGNTFYITGIFLILLINSPLPRLELLLQMFRYSRAASL